MSEDQYQKANARAFLVNNIILASIFLLVLTGGISGGFTVVTIIEMAGCIAGYSLALFGRVRAGGKKAGAIMIMGGSSIVFFLVMILQNNMAYILFGLTVLFSSMVYLNLRIVYSGEAVIVTAYVISIIRILMERKFTGTDYIYTIVLVLSGIAASESVKLLIRFNEENNAVIQDNYAKQNLTGMKMTEVAGEISSLFEKAKENIENLRGVIESNHSGMQNIATSMESTAQEITDQATKCQEIQEHAQATEEKRVQMVQASQNARNTVAEGKQTILQLKEQAAGVEADSQVTVESTRAVLDKVREVQNIVGSILSISKQTNLLALNASIEAARAGAAGAGFAVVAEEIRQLSEQTNTASGEISRIIGELTTDADHAMESIDRTVVSVREQNGMISTAQDNFVEIHDNVSELIERFSEIGEGMKAIVASTAVINDSISSLSATSEEVAALSSEGLTSSNKAVMQFTDFDRTLAGIYEQAEKLRRMQND